MEESKLILVQEEKMEIKMTQQDTEEFIRKLLYKYDDPLHAFKYVIKIDEQTLKIKLVLKEELVNGKSDLEELNHPYFSNIRNKTKIEKNILNFDEKKDKILIFSPHPDDEILGACGLLYKCFLEKIDIKVIYMTTGCSAGGSEVRKSESKNGIKLLGGSDENCVFESFPFYNRKGRGIEESDYEYGREIIRKYSPTNIFICADIFDPNKTHKKCFEILTLLIEEKEFSHIDCNFYYSIWYWPQDDEYTHILPYDYDTYKHKIYAMLEHKSQIENKFMGDDSRPFYQRAAARDTSFGKKHSREYCEVYYRVTK
jgi:LmbE family N-acetylglucosaminyl deacetylase